MMATEGLGSAFTTGGLVGQLAFLLLVLGVMTSRYKSARAFIAVAALIGLCHSILWTGTIVAAFWWGLLMVASLLVLSLEEGRGGKGCVRTVRSRGAPYR